MRKPRYPRSVRYKIWPEDVAEQSFRELQALDPGVLSDDDWPCGFAEVTVGKRSAGVTLLLPFGVAGWAVGPIPREEGEDPPEYWLDDTKGADIEAYFLWFACDVSDVPFQPVYEELLALRAQSRSEIREELAARHGWRCHICGDPIPESLRGINYVIERPDAQFPDIEHVIPLSRGGLHFYGNLRLAHRSCNQRKGHSDNAPPAPLMKLRQGRLMTGPIVG
ncbi:MAG: HNH endonuclease [Actinomycetota bacterium]